MQHECSEMKRAAEIRTPMGIAAYNVYSLWMSTANRKVPSIETFSMSRYFNSIIKFVEWSRKVKLPSNEHFIKLMVTMNMLPTLWCRDECYSLYLEWVDRTSDPLDQAGVTIDTLFKISEVSNTTVAGVFAFLNYREVMQLIRQRLLSPWLLLCSTEFKKFLTGLEGPERDELLHLIGYSYWAEKFEANPKVVEQMKLLAMEMGI